ncbi:hypothetical protein Y032_0046g1307 [Ancylostoma ceylanicum]|nr:hypothetical protein Y032_0046g1307 [Ancylostoma ceylanicum]
MSCRARSWIARSAAAAPFSTQFDNFKNKSVTLRRVGTFTSWISMFHAQSTYFSIAPIAREHRIFHEHHSSSYFILNEKKARPPRGHKRVRLSCDSNATSLAIHYRDVRTPNARI